MRTRTDELAAWVGRHIGVQVPELVPASVDASFRSYHRVVQGGSSWIVMDAPPEREDSRPFVRVAGHLHGLGVHVPQVHAADLEHGFLLLEDLGDRLYLDALTEDDDVDRLYCDALATLVRMQAGGWREPGSISDYDDGLMLREMRLFWDWLLARHLGRDGSADVHRLDELATWLLPEVQAQPRVFVHRDYHSRNLMVCEEANPGVLDFQDAVVGPISYDLVSLLKDCYIDWPRARVEKWVQDFHARASDAGVGIVGGADALLEGVDLMGVQRELKAAGIFCRLYYRDGKSGYLADIPRTLGYIVEAAARHPRLTGLGRWLSDEILPALEIANARELHSA